VFGVGRPRGCNPAASGFTNDVTRQRSERPHLAPQRMNRLRSRRLTCPGSARQRSRLGGEGLLDPRGRHALLGGDLPHPLDELERPPLLLPRRSGAG